MGMTQKLEYLKETKEAIKNALTSKGVAVAEDTAFREYSDLIDNMSIYEFPYDFSGADYKYKEDAPSIITVAPPPVINGSYYGMCICGVDYTLHDELTFYCTIAQFYNPLAFYSPRYMTNRIGNNSVVVMQTDKPKMLVSPGLLLPERGDLASNWIYLNGIDPYEAKLVETEYTIKIKNLYLNKLLWTVAYDGGAQSIAGRVLWGLVDLFENLEDVTNETEDYTLYIGTTNLANLTEEQKNIAYVKGWNLA